MRNKLYWVIKIKYSDGTQTYVYNKYSRVDGRTLITPYKDEAQKFVSKKAAESWFDTVRKYWRVTNKTFTLEAEAVGEDNNG